MSRTRWAAYVRVVALVTAGVLASLTLSGCGKPASPGPRTRPEATRPGPARQGQEATVVVEPVADVRREPEDAAELVTQVLFNERVELLGDADGWIWVKVPDGYEGWMRRESLATFSADESPWSAVTGRVHAVRPVVPLYAEPRKDANPVKNVYLGTPLGVVEKEGAWLAVRLPGTGKGWVEARDVLTAGGGPPRTDPAKAVLDTARLLLGIPYLWGGTSPEGYDCSGLVYEVYKIHGIKLPRDADEQFKVGRKVAREGMAPGDLVFFSAGEPDPTHVAIFAGEDRVIEAVRAGGVQVTRLSTIMARRKYLGTRRFVP